MIRSGLVATALAAVLFAATTGALVAGRSAGVVRVSGASIGSIELTLEEGDAGGTGGRVRLGQGAVRFGTNLTPDGTPSDSPR